MSVIAVATNDNITLTKGGKRIIINKKKSEKIYEEVLDKIQTEGGAEWLENSFEDLKKRVEEVSKGMFTLDDANKIVIAGTNYPVPTVIVNKLIDLQNNGESIEPLIAFWKKLCLNPSENSRKDLYDFMLRNKIPITEQGDIVTEKGVNQKEGSYIGHLVDCHSRKIDNSVGQVVSVDRSLVDSDSSKQCSYGLHVGAPHYVRNHWNSDVIVECVVDPRDVVSVPKDYNATKMRVCKYRVVGYASKSREIPVMKLSDFIQEIPQEKMDKLEEKARQEPRDRSNDTGVISQKIEEVIEQEVPDAMVEQAQIDIEGMTAKSIVDFVQEKTGTLLTYSLKSKKTIQKKAVELLSEQYFKDSLNMEELKEVEKESPSLVEEETEQLNEVKEVNLEKTVNLAEMSFKELKDFAKSKFNETYSFLSSRKKVEADVIKKAEQAGYTIIR